MFYFGLMSQREFYTPGIPNGWFQVAYCDEVEPGQVVPLRYFGKDLVLFRTMSGDVQVLDAFCPHLGAHLGYGGKVIEDTIECPFHAWRFNTAGECVEIPYAKKVPPKAKIPCWPVKEVAGLIMVWNHVGGEAPQWDIPEVPEYGDDGWTDYARRRWQIRTRNQEMAENQVDTAHFRYVHGTRNVPDSDYETEGPVFRVHSDAGMSTPQGDVEGSIESLSHGFGFSTIRFKGIVETLLVSSVTPIDDDNVDVRFSFSIKKFGGADVTKGVGKAFIAEVSRQLDEDIPIWENKTQFARPMLCDGDGPIGLFRRWCRQFYVWPEGAPVDESESQPEAAE